LKAPTDLGLKYEKALHGVQTATAYEMGVRPQMATDLLKHLRTGLDARASDHFGLARLLIQKGVITEAEYAEAMRLEINNELAMREEDFKPMKFR